MDFSTKTLAAGCFGKVYKQKYGDKWAAVKKVPLHLVSHKELLRECQVYQKAQHNNVVKLLGEPHLKDGKYHIPLEFVFGEDLETTIFNVQKSKIQLTQSVKTTIITGMCEGLNFLHIKDIVHQDLKPDNIMIEHESHRAVIIDMGLAKFFKNGLSSAVNLGNEAYAAPEILQGSIRDKRSDVWAMGKIIAELCARIRLPTRSVDPIKIKEYLKDNPYCNVASKMVVMNAPERATMIGVIQEIRQIGAGQGAGRPHAGMGAPLGALGQGAAMMDFSTKTLAEGSFGKVYKQKYGDKWAAVKKVPLHLISHKEILRECQVYQKAQHNNVVKLLGEPWLKDGKCHIPLEFVFGEDLETTIFNRSQSKIQPTRSVKATIITGMCEGLNFLHSKDIVHQDLKPDNIMIEHGSHRAVIIDMGLAKFFKNGLSSAMNMGNEAYSAPEIWKMSVRDKRSDVWAMGKIIAEFCQSVRLQTHGLTQFTIKEVLKDSPYCSVVSKMVAHSAAERATMAGVIGEIRQIEAGAGRPNAVGRDRAIGRAGPPRIVEGPPVFRRCQPPLHPPQPIVRKMRLPLAHPHPPPGPNNGQQFRVFK